MKKMLVVYYTWSNGNTERIAKMLAEATARISCRSIPRSRMREATMRRSCGRYRKNAQKRKGNFGNIVR